MSCDEIAFNDGVPPANAEFGATEPLSVNSPSVEPKARVFVEESFTVAVPPPSVDVAMVVDAKSSFWPAIVFHLMTMLPDSVDGTARPAQPPISFDAVSFALNEPETIDAPLVPVTVQPASEPLSVIAIGWFGAGTESVKEGFKPAVAATTESHVTVSP